jgi:hypothetical protein
MCPADFFLLLFLLPLPLLLLALVERQGPVYCVLKYPTSFISPTLPTDTVVVVYNRILTNLVEQNP